MPPVFPLFHSFTQEATPRSKSAMMLLVTLSYRAEMCMCSSSLPVSENSGAGARGGSLGSSYQKESPPERAFGLHCTCDGACVAQSFHPLRHDGGDQSLW